MNNIIKDQMNFLEKSTKDTFRKKPTLKQLETYYWANLAKHNEDEVGLENWLSQVADGEIKNPLE